MRNSILVLSLLMFFQIQVNAAKIEIPQENIKAGSERYHENGSLQRVFLKEPMDYQGMQLKGWTWIFEDGVLDQSVLAEDYEYGQILLPAGSTVFFENGETIISTWLAHKMTFQGLYLSGGKTFTRLYPDGSLKSVFLRKNATIKGIPCGAGGLSSTHFDEDGNVTHCILYKDYKNNGIIYKAGTEIWLDAKQYVIKSKSYNWFQRTGRNIMEFIFR